MNFIQFTCQYLDFQSIFYFPKRMISYFHKVLASFAHICPHKIPLARILIFFKSSRKIRLADSHWVWIWMNQYAETHKDTRLILILSHFTFIFTFGGHNSFCLEFCTFLENSNSIYLFQNLGLVTNSLILVVFRTGEYLHCF